MSGRIRVLVAKPGLDGHDRGVKVVAAGLRNAGMEVIYTGLFQRPEAIVETALQEDVDVIGLSLLSGAHMTLFPKVKCLMQQQGIGDKLLIAGGIISQEDIEKLKADEVVEAVFGPGATIKEIVHFIRENVNKRRNLLR